MQKLKEKIKKVKQNKELKRNNPLLYNLKMMYTKDYGESDIYSYTDLEDNLYRNILSVESEKEFRELELETKLQMEYRERNNIIAACSLCLSVIALLVTCLINIANITGVINKMVFILLGCILFATITVDIASKVYSDNRYYIPYYKLKLDCIEKVKKEQKKSKRKGTSKYKAKKKEVEM